MKFVFNDSGKKHPEPIPKDECKNTEGYAYYYYWTINTPFIRSSEAETFLKEMGFVPQAATHKILGVEWLAPKMSRMHVLSIRDNCELDYHKCTFDDSGHDGSDEAACAQFEAEFMEESELLVKLKDHGIDPNSFYLRERRVLPLKGVSSTINFPIGDLSW